MKSTSEASAEPESVPLGTPAYAVSAPDISDIIALVCAAVPAAPAPAPAPELDPGSDISCARGQI